MRNLCTRNLVAQLQFCTWLYFNEYFIPHRFGGGGRVHTKPLASLLGPVSTPPLASVVLLGGCDINRDADLSIHRF